LRKNCHGRKVIEGSNPSASAGVKFVGSSDPTPSCITGRISPPPPSLAEAASYGGLRPPKRDAKESFTITFRQSRSICAGLKFCQICCIIIVCLRGRLFFCC